MWEFRCAFAVPWVDMIATFVVFQFQRRSIPFLDFKDINGKYCNAKKTYNVVVVGLATTSVRRPGPTFNETDIPEDRHFPIFPELCLNFVVLLGCWSSGLSIPSAIGLVDRMELASFLYFCVLSSLRVCRTCEPSVNTISWAVGVSSETSKFSLCIYTIS